MSSYHTSFTYKDKNSFDEGYIIVAFEPDNGFKDTFLSMDNISDEYYDGTKRFDYGSKYNASSEVQITIIKKDGTDMSVKDFRECARWLTGARINSWLDMCIGEINKQYVGNGVTQQFKLLDNNGNPLFGLVIVDIDNQRTQNFTYDYKTGMLSLNFMPSVGSTIDVTITPPIYSFLGKFLNMEQYKLDARTIGCRLTFSSLSPWAYSVPQVFDCITSQSIYLCGADPVISYEPVETGYANQTISQKDSDGNWDTVSYASSYNIVDGTITLVDPKKITLDNDGSYESVDYNRVETPVADQRISYKNTVGTDYSSYSWDRVDYADEIDTSTGQIILIDSKYFLLGDTSDNSVVLGKYIKTAYNDKFYYIPDTATIKYIPPATQQGLHSQYMTVDNATEISIQKTSHVTSINPIILGKYIYTKYDNNYYHINSDAELSCNTSGTDIKASSATKITVKEIVTTLTGDILCKSKDGSENFGLDGTVLTLSSIDKGSCFCVDSGGAIFVDTSYNTRIDNQSDDLYTYIYLDIDYENTSGDKFFVNNKTLEEETIVAGLKTSEKISISDKQFILSDSPHHKTFGDDFNFVWPRLAPGLNDLSISAAGTGRAQFTYRYPMKIGDCTIDIDVNGNAIGCDNYIDGGSGETFTGTISWNKITNKPNTIAGYGIQDAYTIDEVDNIIENIEVGDGVVIGGVAIDEKELNDMLSDVLN